ncbi:hypothetical protein CHS0354_030995 [Potamilus streckersoni]|uniref:Uncharacterized protein n=1 Tax=Potamilus streckersoni TaxID=2493646 RepID=A0AAE0VPJ8_9BIVA|nr:hypothetical protein CHS0354_030995 [Potamilus streckersoni]
MQSLDHLTKEDSFAFLKRSLLISFTATISWLRNTGLLTREDRNVHIPGFSPGYSLAQGDCLYSSLSYLWTGNMNQMVHIFRLGAAAHAALHIEHHLRKLMSEGFSSVDDVRMMMESFCPEEVRQRSPEANNPEELLRYILQEEARLTAKPNCYSGVFAGQGLCGVSY